VITVIRVHDEKQDVSSFCVINNNQLYDVQTDASVNHICKHNSVNYRILHLTKWLQQHPHVPLYKAQISTIKFGVLYIALQNFNIPWCN